MTRLTEVRDPANRATKSEPALAAGPSKGQHVIGYPSRVSPSGQPSRLTLLVAFDARQIRSS